MAGGPSVSCHGIATLKNLILWELKAITNQTAEVVFLWVSQKAFFFFQKWKNKKNNNKLYKVKVFVLIL